MPAERLVLVIHSDALAVIHSDTLAVVGVSLQVWKRAAAQQSPKHETCSHVCQIPSCAVRDQKGFGGPSSCRCKM